MLTVEASHPRTDDARTRASSLNEQLRAEYLDALGGDALVPGASGQSAPLLLQVPSSYPDCRVKLMVVGQETFKWCDDGACASPYDVSKLMQAYADFDLGGRWGGTPFWQGAHELYRALNPSGPAKGFLWSNLVKLDVGGHRPGEELTRKVLALRLLQRELAITRPDVVVFLTGPHYDELLKQSFASVAFDALEPGLCCLRDESGLLPTNCFRTYHPKYLRLSKRWRLLQAIADAASAS